MCVFGAVGSDQTQNFLFTRKELLFSDREVWLFACSTELSVCHCVHPDLLTNFPLIEIIAQSTSRMCSLSLSLSDCRSVDQNDTKKCCRSNPDCVSLCVSVFMNTHLFVHLKESFSIVCMHTVYQLQVSLHIYRMCAWSCVGLAWGLAYMQTLYSYI